MSFINTILYSRDTLTIENIYDAIFSKEKMKHPVRTKPHGDGLIVDDDSRMDKLRFNLTNEICNYCKRKWHLVKDFYKL